MILVSCLAKIIMVLEIVACHARCHPSSLCVCYNLHNVNLFTVTTIYYWPSPSFHSYIFRDFLVSDTFVLINFQSGIACYIYDFYQNHIYNRQL
jgi:hypothetical protein